MSIIVHRCQECGHIANWHKNKECSGGLCTCTRRPEAIWATAPEIMPTYDHAGLVTTVHEPGTRWAQETLCDCDACRELYQREPAPA